MQNVKHLYQDKLYQVALDEEANVLKFIWQKDHPSLDLVDFKEACGNYIGYGFEFQAKRLLINTQDFTYTPPKEFYEWQKTVHHDRYRKIGVEKVAYVMQTAHMEYVTNTPGTESGFATHYFDNAAEAMSWLAE